ncbi:MAG: hypothetical protein GY953_43310 [bacterium]|nr:hypothetical protein [bacterium]
MVNIRQPHRIVGVARDVKYGHVRQASEPYVYIAMNQRGYLMFTLHVRAASNPAALVAPVSRVLRGIDPNLPFQVRTVAKHVDNQGYLDRLFAGAIGCFALVALVLAVVGVYGVMSYAVRQRSREFGIRSALGAREGRIVREVVRKGLTITLAGITVGLFGAIGLSRILVSQLFGVRGFEAVIIAAMSLGLIVIALLACYIPARWAARVDPATALRCE